MPHYYVGWLLDPLGVSVVWPSLEDHTAGGTDLRLQLLVLGPQPDTRQSCTTTNT